MKRLIPVILVGLSAVAVFAANDKRDALVGPSRPKSLVKPGPDFADGKSFAKAESITAFSQLRANDQDPGLLGMMVAVGEVEIDPAEYGSGFDPADCEVKPGYFSVLLKDHDVRVDMTSGHSVVAYRYTFDETKEAHVLMDVSYFLEGFKGGEIRMRDDKTYEGFGTYRIGKKNTDLYFSFQYSKPFRQRGAWKDGELHEGRHHIESDDDESLGAYAYFWTHGGETVLMKVGVSTESIEDARANLAEEFPGWDFDAFCKESALAW